MRLAPLIDAVPGTGFGAVSRAPANSRPVAFAEVVDLGVHRCKVRIQCQIVPPAGIVVILDRVPMQGDLKRRGSRSGHVNRDSLPSMDTTTHDIFRVRPSSAGSATRRLAPAGASPYMLRRRIILNRPPS